VHGSQVTTHYIDKFLQDSGQLIATNMSTSIIANESSPTISDMFPINTEENLIQFEANLNNIYRKNAVTII